jgi:hypothetical protein
MVSHFLFEAEFCNPASGWEKGQIEKNVRGMPAICSGNPRRASPRWRRCQRLAGDALPGTVGSDAARLASWRDCRRLGRRGPASDAAFAPVRRLRRIRQSRVADVPGPSGPQSLQRAGLLRQSSSQRASVSRAHRRRRRGADRLRTSSRFCPLLPFIASRRTRTAIGSTMQRWHSLPSPPPSWMSVSVSLSRCPCAAGQGLFFREGRSGGSVVGCHHRIVLREIPFRPVLVWCHSIGREMSLERLEFLPIIEANQKAG